FDDHSFRITPEYITTARDTMEHRGPDGAGTWVSPDGRIGLGHRRLSIIDLSEAATQPMSLPDGSIRVVFNGEIYNHAEIRRELESIGHRDWQTSHSDTEVVLRAFAEWGIDCLERFRGMFAIAIWDARNESLWLVRDRIGIKPMYFSVHHGRLVFASEIKALLEDPDQPRAVNEDALYHYLSFLTTPAPHTLFDGIQKLPPGSWMRVRPNGRMETQKYWDVLDHTESLAGVSEDEIATRVLDELRTAVKLRKVGDVPVGVFLSGGIDSSTNAALFSEGESNAIRTFSIGYEGDYDSYENELHFARQMADEVGAEYHEKLLRPEDLLSFLPRMVYLQDEPIADPVCVPVYYVSELARNNGVTVCQVGEGADELFWGYRRWKAYLQLQQANSWPIPNFVKSIGLGAMKAAGQGATFPYELLRRGASGEPIFWGGAEAFSEGMKQELLSPRMREKFRGRTSWEALQPIRDRFLEKAKEPGPLNWMSYLDLNFRLPELLLMRVDKMSMGVSLEGRVPFLDHKFVELAMSIPQAMKTKNGTLKHLLKKAVRGLIPDNLIDRRKQGFAVPVREWLLEQLGDTTRKEVLDVCRETDLFDEKAVMALIDSKKGVRPWYLLNFAMWWKQNIAGVKSEIPGVTTETA
ncbi:MAG: asparagine synthase (glutamine-hydrolyzing), partial [Planctomycetota bacterium]